MLNAPIAYSTAGVVPDSLGDPGREQRDAGDAEQPADDGIERA